MQDSLYSTLPTSGLLKRHVEVMLTPGPESDPLAKGLDFGACRDPQCRAVPTTFMTEAEMGDGSGGQRATFSSSPQTMRARSMSSTK